MCFPFQTSMYAAEAMDCDSYFKVAETQVRASTQQVCLIHAQTSKNGSRMMAGNVCQMRQQICVISQCGFY